MTLVTRCMRSLLQAAALVLSIACGMPAHAQVAEAVYAVAYVDAAPASKAAVIAVFKQYREASGKDPGYGGIEILEQIERPAHFALVETWRDQPALDAHLAAAHTQQFMNALKPLRLSAYDQRIYKTLSAAIASTSNAKETIAVVTHVDIGGTQANAPELLRQFAEASRKEQGNLRFDAVQQNTRRNHFTLLESWRNRAAFDAHASAAHTRQFREEITPATGSPMDERIYKVIE